MMVLLNGIVVVSLELWDDNWTCRKAKKHKAFSYLELTKTCQTSRQILGHFLDTEDPLFSTQKLSL